MLQDLRARRKSYDHTKHLGVEDSSRQGAKSAKFGLTIFFAAFASLREIFRIFGCGFAALGFFLVGSA